MPPSLREAVRMALDAYDARAYPGDETAPVFADPAVERAFPRWTHLPGPDGFGPRNATGSRDSGLDYNVYLDAAAGQAVVAFRGTELGFLLEALGAGDVAAVAANNLLEDVLTVFGYYQDGGATVREAAGAAGIAAFIEGAQGLDPGLAADAADLLGALLGVPAEAALEAAIAAGEATLALQASQAIETVLAVAAANPGVAVSVTGHSLGGALAAHAAAALGVPATVFDPAPWAAQPFLGALRAEADALLAGPFAGLDTAAAGWERGADAAQTAADRVTTYRLEGSFVEDAYLSADPRALPTGAGSDTVIPLSAEGLAPFFLHAPALHALVIDSAERATPDRPSFAALAERLPGLAAHTAEGRLVSPVDGEAETFHTHLLVEDAYYALFADYALRIASDITRFDGPGADTAGLEAALTGRALATLGAIAAAQDFDAGATVADGFGDPLGGPGPDVIVGAFGVAETVSPGPGADLVATGAAAADTIRGTAAELDGDTLLDFAPGDTLIFDEVRFGPERLSVAADGLELALDADGDGAAEARIALARPLAAKDLVLLPSAEGTALAFAGPGFGAGADAAAAGLVPLLYRAALGRPPDMGGLNHWIDVLEAGRAPHALAAAFLGADEFTAAAGAIETLEPEGLVDALYAAALGRTAEAGGRAYWSAQLAEPDFAPADLLLALAGSAELAATDPGGTLAEIEPGLWAFG